LIRAGIDLYTTRLATAKFQHGLLRHMHHEILAEQTSSVPRFLQTRRPRFTCQSQPQPICSVRFKSYPWTYRSIQLYDLLLRLPRQVSNICSCPSTSEKERHVDGCSDMNVNSPRSDCTGYLVCFRLKEYATLPVTPYMSGPAWLWPFSRVTVVRCLVVDGSRATMDLKGGLATSK